MRIHLLLAVSLLCFGACGVGVEEAPEPLAPEDDVLDVDDAELAARPCGTMKGGSRLSTGQVFSACGGAYWLQLQADGNLVLYGGNPTRAKWATSTYAAGVRMEMQADGNLVVYRGAQALWASNTSGNPGATLAMQDDGNLVIYRSGKALWSTRTSECGVLFAGAVLKPGARKSSCDRRFELVMQSDNNLVLYRRSDHKALWSSVTSRTGSATMFASLQTDGNLVVRRNGTALWNSRTAGHAQARLFVRNDGTLDLVAGGATVWEAPGAPKPSVPASLLAKLDEKPYVEQSCSAATFPGWPHEAKRCSYSSGGLSATVVTATPAAERVAQWVVDSADQIPALKALRTSNPAEWERGLGVIADRTIIASGRIFPLAGGVIEQNQETGVGYRTYDFEKGVTETCGSGCYCRINSLHRSVWCSYRSGTGKETYSACSNRLGTYGYTTAWGNECMKLHADAWSAASNESFRAQAWSAAQNMRCRSPGSCSAAETVEAVREQYR